MTGLPFSTIEGLLASITPAAGDAGGEGSSAEELADLEPAAGGGDEVEESCWSDALTAAAEGMTVNFKFGGGVDDMLNKASGCLSEF